MGARWVVLAVCIALFGYGANATPNDPAQAMVFEVGTLISETTKTPAGGVFKYMVQVGCGNLKPPMSPSCVFIKPHESSTTVHWQCELCINSGLTQGLCLHSAALRHMAPSGHHDGHDGDHGDASAAQHSAGHQRVATGTRQCDTFPRMHALAHTSFPWLTPNPEIRTQPLLPPPHAPRTPPTPTACYRGVSG